MSSNNNNNNVWIVGMIALLVGFTLGWNLAIHQIEKDKRQIHINWPGGGYHGEYYPDR